MSKIEVKTISACMNHILELATGAVKMRKIVDNPQESAELRYRAVVIEEGQLDLIVQFVERIKRMQQETLDADFTSGLHSTKKRNKESDG